MNISQRASQTEPFHALAFGRRAAELEAAGHTIIKLSIGEPDFGALPTVRAAMQEVMDGRPLPYTMPLGSPALRQAISGFYRERHGVEVDPGRIIITVGASGGILLALAATIDPDDEVILADPWYPSYLQTLQSLGGRAVAVATTPESRYQLDATSVQTAWTARTRAVMIATPSNPTGTSLPIDELAAICEIARTHDAWRIVDEIYLNLSDWSDDGVPPATVLTVDPDAIVINSFSKYFGMTGWRLGWMVVPEALVPTIERLAMHWFLSASNPVQQAALACFTPESLAICEERRDELVVRRRIVLDGLRALELPVPVVPDGAFYVYFDVSDTGLGAWEFCERALEEAHVALTPGKDFGEITADTHVRLSYAASRDELEEGLRRLGAFLMTLPSREVVGA